MLLKLQCVTNIDLARNMFISASLACLYLEMFVSEMTRKQINNPDREITHNALVYVKTLISVSFSLCLGVGSLIFANNISQIKVSEAVSLNLFIILNSY